jgi:hypothetical protein
MSSKDLRLWLYDFLKYLMTCFINSTKILKLDLSQQGLKAVVRI